MWQAYVIYTYKHSELKEKITFNSNVTNVLMIIVIISHLTCFAVGKMFAFSSQSFVTVRPTAV